MINLEDKIEELKVKCSEHKMRLTPQRIEVLKMIASSTAHPDADVVYDQVRKVMPSISLDTVYRTLTSLEELGMIFKVDNELPKTRYDANIDPHSHFICVRCGAVFDIFHKEEIKAPKESFEFGDVIQANLQVKGICNKCKGDKK